ncbi:hypothetical protein C8Q75DRAFT_776404 [Abortiporus biennis]|nr:hypothetical protein C8Q75DRAFT_776404 [Abortiporus biennis]
MATKASAAKEEGNRAFKAGNYPEAVGHYTAAILANPNDPTFHLNRAAAYLKLGKYLDAERDCSTVINLDPKNVKAWYRRAQARISLRKLADSETDLHRLLNIDPNNKDAQRELDIVRELSVAASQKSNLRVPLDPSSLPGTCAPRRRRVPITIVEPSGSPPSSPPPSVKQSGSQKDGITPISSRPIFSKKFSSPSTSSPTFSPASPPSTPTVRGGIFRANGQHTIFNQKSTNASPVPATPLDQPQSQTKAPSLRPSPTVPLSAPTSLVNFTRIWANLRDPKQRWEYIQLISPDTIPSLFQTSLEPSMLSAILHTFETVLSDPSTTSGTKQLIKSYMTMFPKVSRWDAVVLFLSADEKKCAQKVWTLLSGVSDEKDEEVIKAWKVNG